MYALAYEMEAFRLPLIVDTLEFGNPLEEECVRVNQLLL